MAAADAAASDGDCNPRLAISEDIIDLDVFRVILEFDQDEPGFSREVIFAFFDQARDQLKSMEKALAEKDLRALQGLSYSLRGYAASIGVRNLQEECHNIVGYSRMRDEVRGLDLDLETSVRVISEAFTRVKSHYEEAEKEFKSFYDRYQNI